MRTLRYSNDKSNYTTHENSKVFWVLPSSPEQAGISATNVDLFGVQVRLEDIVGLRGEHRLGENGTWRDFGVRR